METWLLLWIHFPVWRELKLSILTTFEISSSSEYTFPFEGNGNSTMSVPKPTDITTSLWIHFPVWRELKRLSAHFEYWWTSIYSEYTFPFEGNWNVEVIEVHIGQNLASEYTFPFEGNWNNTAKVTTTAQTALNTLSRLKGIETIKEPCRFIMILYSLNTLSRLKGIETILSISFASWVSTLWIHFPVWRELKLPSNNQMVRPIYLWIHFPVWRELKLLFFEPVLCWDDILWIHFPVWREWKLVNQDQSAQ